MKSPASAFALTAIVLALTACNVGGRTEHLALEQTPPAVMDGFKREFPGLVLSHTDKITEVDGTVQYELKFRDARHEYRRKMFSPTGALLGSKDDVVPTTPAP